MLVMNIQGFGYSGDHEEGQMVEGIPAYEIGSKKQAVGRKLNRDEAEALASKEGEMKSLFCKKDRKTYRMHDCTLTLQGGIVFEIDRTHCRWVRILRQ